MRTTIMVSVRYQRSLLTTPERWSIPSSRMLRARGSVSGGGSCAGASVATASTRDSWLDARVGTDVGCQRRLSASDATSMPARPACSESWRAPRKASAANSAAAAIVNSTPAMNNQAGKRMPLLSRPSA